jgi:hypothetical protein
MMINKESEHGVHNHADDNENKNFVGRFTNEIEAEVAQLHQNPDDD